MAHVNYSVIGKRIKCARERAGLTLAQVAERCGIQQYQTVSKWEKANTLPSLKNLLDLCGLFHCDIGFLTGEHEGFTREATDIQVETGLSEEAIQHLSRLQNIQKKYKGQVPGDWCKNKLDFYSAFISDIEMVGLLELFPNKIRKAKDNDLNDSEIDVFGDGDSAMRFYRFEAMEAILRFFDRYFDNMEFHVIGGSENG